MQARHSCSCSARINLRISWRQCCRRTAGILVSKVWRSHSAWRCFGGLLARPSTQWISSSANGSLSLSCALFLSLLTTFARADFSYHLEDSLMTAGRASCSCRLNFAAGCNYLDLDFQAAASWCLASFAPCMKTKLMLVLISWLSLILDRIILGQRYLPRAIAQFLSFMVNFELMVSLTLWVLLDLQLQLPPFADSCYQTLTIA